MNGQISRKIEPRARDLGGARAAGCATCWPKAAGGEVAVDANDEEEEEEGEGLDGQPLH